LNLAPLLAVGLLAAASVQHPDMARPNAAPLDHAGAVSSSSAAAHAVPVRPAVGELAPDFTYQSWDYQWQNLHDMLGQGDVLLVFASTDDELRALERDRGDLLKSGVLPVAVVMQHEADAWRAVHRFDLAYSLLADPHGAIAEQYGVFDALTNRNLPAWFVIDRQRRVRASGSAAGASHDWTALAGAALGRSDVHAASSH